MIILGIDTSSTSLSLAVTDHKLLRGEYTLHHKLTHSEQLMPSIDFLLKSLDMTPKDLDAIGVSIGPGSFTGIRIGVSTANAMAMGLHIPVVGVSSLEGMAKGAGEYEQPVFATLDAQRNRVYRGAYQQGKILLEEDVIELSQLYQELESYPGAMLLGDGAFMLESLPKNTLMGAKNRLYIRASEVCLLTQKKIELHQDKGYASPVYLRKSQAEIQFEERQEANHEGKK